MKQHEDVFGKDAEKQSLRFGIDGIVAELRNLRIASLAQRQRVERPPKLPARKSLNTVVEGISAVLFPNRLGYPELLDEGLDHYVGHTLDVTLRELQEQLRRELQFISGQNDDDAAIRAKAFAMTRDFAAQLPAVRVLLESDVIAAYEGDPAARSVDEVLVCYPGILAMIHHRLAHVLHLGGAPLVARMIAEIAHSITGIDIHPGAQIGPSFFIDHGTGVVIGETAIIGQRVRVYQAVTLGAKRFPVDEQGNLLKGNARHPIVEDDVVIYAGATILGRITIGQGSTIGGNVWLTRSVPPGSSITQMQVRNDIQE